MSNGNLYQMDCSAIVYPYLATDTIQHSFTMEADLDRDIDPELLKTVVQRLCERFPTLFVRLHRGKLGYKLEHVHDVTPFVMPRPQFLNMPYDLKNNENLIRITYKGCRLAVECFHSVTDGNGAITLLKSIMAEYFRALGEDIPNTCGVLSPEDAPKPTETEDSFRTNFVSAKDTIARTGKMAFQYSPKGPFAPWHQTELAMPLSEIKPMAKAAGATLTEFGVALYLYAFYMTEKGKISNKPIVMSVPINLRPLFGSETLRNFALYFFASVPKGKDVSFEDILENVKKEFKIGTDKELIQRMINSNVSQQDMAIFRMLPRAVKGIALRVGAAFCGECLFTSTLSNLGIFKVPDELAVHVKTFHAVLGQVPKNHILTTAYCYNGTLGFMFSSRLQSREIEHNVQHILCERGVHALLRDNETGAVL